VQKTIKKKSCFDEMKKKMKLSNCRDKKKRIKMEKSGKKCLVNGQFW
jgi:hypothetical protein